MVSELTAGRIGTGGMGTLLLEGARVAEVVLVVFSIVLLGFFVSAGNGCIGKDSPLHFLSIVINSS